MNDVNDILRVLRPVIKGLPLIILLTIITTTLGIVHVYYTIPTYQTSATLKINDSESGVSNFMKKFEPFSTTGQLLTEVEVVRSRYLVKKALKKLNIAQAHFRFVRSKPRLMYQNSPFHIRIHLRDSSFVDHLIPFEYAHTGEIRLYANREDPEQYLEGELGRPFSTPAFDLTIDKNEAFLEEHPGALAPGKYGFEVRSMAKLLGKFANSKYLTVRLLAEDIAIVKIYFIHEVPAVARDFVNALAETYIEDFIENKTQSAQKALNFIDGQLKEVEAELRRSEEALARFKSQHSLVDLKLETDSRLRRLSELEMRKLNLSMEQRELDNLLSLLADSSYRGEVAINFESVSDPAFSGNLSKLQSLRAKLDDLLQKFTPEHPEVQKVQAQIAELHQMLVESVNYTRLTNQQKLMEINRNIAMSSIQFGELPEVEKQLLILTRRFLISEKAYNHLLEKRTEAAIGAAATISFHKIIERASLPQSPLHPQKTIIISLSCILGVAFGIIFIFVRNYIRAAVAAPEDVEKHLHTPLISVIKLIPKDVFEVNQDFLNLMSNIQLMKEEQARLITLASHQSREGREEVAINLAKAFASIGKKTLLIDADLYQPGVHKHFSLINETGLGQMVVEGADPRLCIQSSSVDSLDILCAGEYTTAIPTAIFLHPKLKSLLRGLCENYEHILISGPPLKQFRDVIPLMKMSDLNLFVLRSNKTRFQAVKDAEKLLSSYQIPDLYFVLNQSEVQQKQFQYQTNAGEKMPRIGTGARRKLILSTLRAMMPTIGTGKRRRLLLQMFRTLFNLRR
ncbi:MAG: hypothetical protein D6730_24835 [Bacteroidetes bacterium]|nr:MAG: hypothetical protein D6730_24835 [Bacteroidota bacterium]